MPVVPARLSPRVSPADAPTTGALDRVLTATPAVLRLTCGLACAAVALAVRTPPVHTPLLVAAVTVLTAWSVYYARRATRHGITPALAGTDVALTAGTCLLIPWVVAAQVLPGEVSWVAILASTSVINAQLTAPVRWSVPAGLLITLAYAAGAWRAGDATEAVAHATTLTVQTGCGAVLAFVMRRASRRADAAFAEHQRSAREAVTARTLREAERRQNRDLHDTVLSTLTVVGLGAVAAGSPALRVRAADDLRTLESLAPIRDAAPDTGPVRLDERLRAGLDRVPGLRVEVDLQPCVVPDEVARALVDSTGEALANVARHAAGARTLLRLTATGRSVAIEVIDDGPGFVVDAVPAHRYGLRESMRGRMASLGGRALIESAPGQGTRVRLEWPDAR